MATHSRTVRPLLLPTVCLAWSISGSVLAQPQRDLAEVEVRPADRGQAREQRLEKTMEFKHSMVFEAEAKRQYCSARVELEYTQMNTLAWAAGTIHTPDCGAASGEYTIAVRYRDEGGQLHTLESNEAWRRDDDQPVRFESKYSIGENVDLIRVRARKIRCVCTPETTDDGVGEPNAGGEHQ